ncbi:hypothetical protein [Pseudoduganella violaceinigra]|uniref:hypothetical protein n=1 Tax=Pseudoduganella violaceinigra TaxID=246602 RepID=UPI00040C056C|nr:hypothetical protein [Pseudoduganella violaceinigra]
MKQLHTWQRKIDDLRFRGFGGSAIQMHRSMYQIKLSRSNLLGSLALPIVFTAVLLCLLSPILALWRGIFEFWLPRIAPVGSVGVRQIDLGAYYLDLPYPLLPAGEPGNQLWWITLAASVLALLASFAVSRDRFLPLQYILRACLLVQATALLFFHFFPGEFPYDAGRYIGDALTMALIFLFMMPWGLGATYYVFGFALWRKVGLTVCILAYFILAFPMQYLLHAYVLHHMTLLFLPLLYLVFGIFMDVMMFVALYSWGMSWGRPDARA